MGSRTRPSLLVALGLAIATFAYAPSALASTSFKDIASSGPLNHVYLGNELSCQVSHTGDALLSFYPPDTIPADCGTHLFADNTLFAPDYPAHAPPSSTATVDLGARTPFTPVGQSAVNGTGSSGDPFEVITSVDAGSTGLHITQTDSYVAGQESYRTDIAVNNTGSGAQSVKLYRAGDCVLQGSDTGFGFVNTAAKSVGCSANANNTPPSRVEEWFPLTGENNYYEAVFRTVWGAIGSHDDFPDTCVCAGEVDNGAGISWSFEVPAGGTVTRSQYTTFSPTGIVGPPEPAAAIDDVSQAEGNAGTTNFAFTVTLDRASTDEVKIDYQTADGTAGQPGDYAQTAGTLTFPPGTLTGQITVPVVGDTTPELDETLFVNLSGAQNAVITDPQGLGAIVNDDENCVPGTGPGDYCEASDVASLVRGSVARVVVGCPRYRSPRCSGSVRLEAKRHGRRVLVGKASFRRIARTTRRLAKVNLTRKGKRILRRAGHVRVRVVAVDRVRVGKHRKLRSTRRAIARTTLRARSQ